MPLSPKDHQADLAKRIAKDRADLIKILARSRDKLRGEIIAAARKPEFSSQIAARERLYKAIQAEYKRLNGSLSDHTDKAVESNLRAAFSAAKADIKASGASTKGLSWTKFSAKHLQETIKRVNPYNISSLVAVNAKLTKMAEDDVRQVRNIVLEVFREAAATGMTARERQLLMMERVMEGGENLKSWQFIDKSGRKWNKGNYFNMVNRTVAASVNRDGYSDTLTEAGHDLVQVIGGHSTHDKVCQNKPTGYVGRILSISGSNEDYPSMEQAKADGLFHPNCLHAVIAVIEDMPQNQELIEAEKGTPAPEIPKPKKRTRKTDVKKDSTVAASVRATPEERDIPKPLTSEQQEKAFKESRQRVLRGSRGDGIDTSKDEEFAELINLSTGEVLSDGQGKKSEVDVSGLLRQAEEKGGQWRLIHNHPSGSSFSPEDVGVFLQSGALESIEAVSKGSTFILKKKQPIASTKKGREAMRIMNKLGKKGSKIFDQNLDFVKRESLKPDNDIKVTANRAARRLSHQRMKIISDRFDLEYKRIRG